MPLLENLQLVCAVCRIGVYSVFRRICCGKPAPPRPEFNPVCIGLTEAGKTTILTLLAGEPLEEIVPTSGFIIKCVQFKDCILNIKEIGGSDKIRPYWKHYFSGAQAVIFFVDSSSTEPDMETSKDALHMALRNPLLKNLPCLIVGNCQDKEGALTEEQLKEALELEKACQGRDWVLHMGSMKDVDNMRLGFCKLNTFLVPGGLETSPANSPAQTPTETNGNKI